MKLRESFEGGGPVYNYEGRDKASRANFAVETVTSNSELELGRSKDLTVFDGFRPSAANGTSRIAPGQPHRGPSGPG